MVSIYTVAAVFLQPLIDTQSNSHTKEPPPDSPQRESARPTGRAVRPRAARETCRRSNGFSPDKRRQGFARVERRQNAVREDISAVQALVLI